MRVRDNVPVLMINPPSPFLIEERVFTPTGALYAASELEKAGHPVTVLDLARRAQASDKGQDYGELVGRYEQEYLDQVRAAATEFEHIGVSSTTPQYKFAVKILEAIREANPKAKTVLGGAHATLMSGLRNRRIAFEIARDPSLKQNEQGLEARLDEYDPNFSSVARYDHVVAGAARGMLQVIQGNGNVPKWIMAEPLGRNIDDVPLPARHLIDVDSYAYHLTHPRTGEQVLTTNVMSQWGCPFPCNFCSGRNDDFYRTVRVMSPQHTIAELDHIHEKYGISGFMFFDDEMNVVHPRFMELLELLQQRHEERGYVYRGFVKAELVTDHHPETLQRMAEAGFAEVCTGVESGSNRILTEVIRKNTTYEINLRFAQLAHEAGIRFKAFTMIGHPTETEEDALQTLKWVLEAAPTGFDSTVHQPYPGAPVYDMAVRDPKTGVYFLTHAELSRAKSRIFTEGSSIDDAVFLFRKPDYGSPDSDSFYKGIPGRYKSNVWTPAMSADRIVELRDHIEKTGKEQLGAESVSGLSYDSVMGQSGGSASTDS